MTFRVEPGGCDHSGCVVLKLADCPPDHITDAVNQPNGEGAAIRQLDLRRLLGDKFGLRRHDSTPGAALGQFISGPFFSIDIFDVGNHLGLHKALDKGGFSGTHRPHHADVDIPRRAGGNILIDRGIHSIPSFFRSIFMFHSMYQLLEV